MSIMSEKHSHETEPQAEPQPGDMPSADAVCVCGHYCSEHKDDPYVGCCHVTEIIKYTPHFCLCRKFTPAVLPSPADHESISAHDIPAAKLREQLAQAQRELAAAKRECERLGYVDVALRQITSQRNDMYMAGIDFGRATASGTWMTLDTCCVCRDTYPRGAMAQVDDEKYQCADCLQSEHDQYRERVAALEGQLDISIRHVKWISKAREFWVKTAQDQEERANELQAERDQARADCKLHMESFLTVANAMGTPEAHPQKIANEIAALRAEADSLRAQVAEAKSEIEDLKEGNANHNRAWLKLCKRVIALGHITAHVKTIDELTDIVLEEYDNRHTLSDMAAGLLADKQAHLDAWDEMIRTVAVSE